MVALRGRACPNTKKLIASKARNARETLMRLIDVESKIFPAIVKPTADKDQQKDVNNAASSPIYCIKRAFQRKTGVIARCFR
jgi:putative hemolysin